MEKPLGWVHQSPAFWRRTVGRLPPPLARTGADARIWTGVPPHQLTAAAINLTYTRGGPETTLSRLSAGHHGPIMLCRTATDSENADIGLAVDGKLKYSGFTNCSCTRTER